MISALVISQHPAGGQAGVIADPLPVPDASARARRLPRPASRPVRLGRYSHGAAMVFYAKDYRRRGLYIDRPSSDPTTAVFGAAWILDDFDRST